MIFIARGTIVKVYTTINIISAWRIYVLCLHQLEVAGGDSNNFGIFQQNISRIIKAESFMIIGKETVEEVQISAVIDKYTLIIITE